MNVEGAFEALERAMRRDDDFKSGAANGNAAVVIRNYEIAVSALLQVARDTEDDKIRGLFNEKATTYKDRIEELYDVLPMSPTAELVEVEQSHIEIPVANLVLEDEEGTAEEKTDTRDSALSSLEEFDAKELDLRQEQRIEQRR